MTIGAAVFCSILESNTSNLKQGFWKNSYCVCFGDVSKHFIVYTKLG